MPGEHVLETLYDYMNESSVIRGRGLQGVYFGLEYVFVKKNNLDI